jgi:tripartite-type tricarboxylate transporter receptor subunit TctC
MAPKGIPKPIFDRIYSTLIKVMNDPATREMLARQGADPITSTPEDMLKLINAEYGRFTQAIKLAGLTVQ